MRCGLGVLGDLLSFACVHVLPLSIPFRAKNRQLFELCMSKTKWT